MSSDAESISSGMTLPAWMRSRIEKNDFDGVTFSPPSHDESFFYIRYPVNSTASTSGTTTKTTTTTTSSSSSSFDNDTRNSSGIRHLTDLFSNHNINNENGKSLRPIDFSKHTEPCKRFLKDSPNTPGDTIKNPPKSFGTDDGFKGPGAACGSSIVKVAQQMVSGRSLTSTRGFKVINSLDQQEQQQLQQSSSNNIVDPDSAFQTKTIEDQQIQSSGLIKPQTTKLIDDNITGGSNNYLQQQYHQKFIDQQQQKQQQKQQQQQLADQQQMIQSSRLMYRRGSKSLPSSPLGSPKSMRKYNPNPYFTTTSLFSSNNSSTDGRGWFLSSLLGFQQRETTSSTSSISHIEEESHDLTIIQQNNNNTKTSSSSSTATTSEHQKILRAKPSELREMNFWSPTSM